MTVKKLLIIQMDGTYFLHETVRVLEKSVSSLKNFEITLLTTSSSISDLSFDFAPVLMGITDNIEKVISEKYDLSVNLSMNEDSWSLHSNINSTYKSGSYYKDGHLVISDYWHTFLLTIKAQPPFLAFHLQDIYRNMLGIKRLDQLTPKFQTAREIILGKFNPSFCYDSEFNEFLLFLKNGYPQLILKSIEDVDLLSDFSHSLYIGPATLDAIKLCEVGAKGVFIGKHFQGFNLLPYEGNHYFISTRGEGLRHEKLLPFIEYFIKYNKPLTSINYSIYQTEEVPNAGTYLKSLNISDIAYPFYQGHFVLWNFLLNLYDLNLEIVKCTHEQLSILKDNHHTLSKLLRLHDFAMSSIDTIYQQAKAKVSDIGIIDGHLKNLREIENIMSQIAVGHPFLRPFLDFYHMRRGQNEAKTLLEQAQNSYVVYSEEHHALSALLELFSVTLLSNEVSISK